MKTISVHYNNGRFTVPEYSYVTKGTRVRWKFSGTGLNFQTLLWTVEFRTPEVVDFFEPVPVGGLYAYEPDRTLIVRSATPKTTAELSNVYSSLLTLHKARNAASYGQASRLVLTVETSVKKFHGRHRGVTPPITMNTAGEFKYDLFVDRVKVDAIRSAPIAHTDDDNSTLGDEDPYLVVR